MCVHFCAKRKIHPQPELHIEGQPIPVVNETKFLGVIFDSKLNFVSHIKTLKTKCEKALNLLRSISAFDWGADRDTKLMLYRSLIRSKIDYGSMVYGAARKSYVQILEPIQNRALRICLNAFRTSPAKSLHVEANEPPLHLRRTKLAMQYAIKLYSNPENPTHQLAFNPKFVALYRARPTTIPTFGIRMKSHLENAGIQLEYIANYKISNTPPWQLTKPKIITSLAQTPKQDTPSVLFKQKFLEIKSQWQDHKPIYTDGSKLDDKAAAAIVTQLNTYKQRLPDGASIFTAETRALQLALRVMHISQHKKFIVFVDSLSVLQACENMHIHNPLILDLLEQHHQLILNDYSIVFCWIPSHIGIGGNEQADKAAKEALNLQIQEFLIHYSDFKPKVSGYILDAWQSEWNREARNKLHSINSLIGKKQPKSSSVRDDMVIRRARIGHTFITHNHLLKGEPPPECVGCQETYTH